MEAKLDVLCVGHACFDLVFFVSGHPGADEKVLADRLVSCGGGPAANAAVTAARLGKRAALAGYLGDDVFGRQHRRELEDAGVSTRLVVAGADPTPISAILVKPDGRRTVVHYRGSTVQLAAGSVDFSTCRPKVILFDGHQPQLSEDLIARARRWGSTTVLDAGSVHAGTLALVEKVDYVVAAEKFARDFTGCDDMEDAARVLGRKAPAAVITLGERGLVWQRGGQAGRLAAFTVRVVDTTGAGDTFHGAFAAGLADGKPWQQLLRYASAAGALCCTRAGARLGIPGAEEIAAFVDNHLQGKGQ